MANQRSTRIKAVSLEKKVPETFSIWVNQKSQRTRAGIEALFALPGLALVFSLVSLFGKRYIPQFDLHLDTVTTAVLFVQFAIIGLMYFFIPTVPRLHKRPPGGSHGEQIEADRLTERADQFASLWSYAWLCWAILYFGLGMSSLAKHFFPTVQMWFVSPAANLLNNIQTVFFIMCFRELRYPTHNRRSPLAAAIAAAVVVGVCESFFLIPGVPYREAFGFPLSTALGWASGCLGGATIALLIGRLETKLIDAPVVMTVIFYFYASIQSAFPFLMHDDHLALVFTSLAFIFKLCFFYFMAWLLESGVLMFYFAKMLEFDDKTPRERRSFLEHEVVKTR